MHRLADPHLTDDLPQDVFVKAMRQGRAFCALHDPRALRKVLKLPLIAT